MKKTFALITTLIACFCLHAQDKKPAQHVSFISINQVGLLIGGSGELAMLQTINGIRKKSWSAGIGTGLDFYGQRSIPLFIDLRKQFTQSANKPFIYADAGLHFQWLNNIQNENRGFPDAGPGLYYDAGLGYSLALKKQKAFVLSAGFTYKRLEEKIISNNWLTGTGLPKETVTHRISEYRRIAIKIGISI